MELKIEFSPSNSKAKLKEVLNAVCGILNSFKEGSELILFSESCPYSKKDADDITRKIEQKLETTFGLEATREIIDKIPQTNDGKVFELHYQIKPTTMLPSKLYTINYNLYCTTNTQVHHIPSSEPLEHIVDVIKGEQTREEKFVLGKHQKMFSYGAVVALEESKEIQLKLLDDKVTDKCSLADRMTNESNKLVYYISAFANGSGGHIYYGIKLNESGSYVAYGQTVHDKEKIINKVKSTIDKLFVWPGIKESLKKGQQWDIYFQNVLNTEEAKYVIVISVNSHDRGVFVREPESYIIAYVEPKDAEEGVQPVVQPVNQPGVQQGVQPVIQPEVQPEVPPALRPSPRVQPVLRPVVQPMRFCEWIVRFLLTNYRNIFPHEKFPRIIGRCEWSSPEALIEHLNVLKQLVILRNDGRGEEFNEYKDKLLTGSDANTKCLIQQQEAGNFFRKRLLNEAEAKLKENEDLLNETPGKCADVGIYQTRRLYWASVVKRAQGNYAKCRELCEEALQGSQHQPTILVLPWIHYNQAKMVEIDIAKEEDASEEHCLRTTAMGCYESALRSSFALQGFPKNLVIDLQQRVLIAMARLSLGAIYDGEHVVHKACFPCDIKHADYLLDVVDGSVVKQGWPMTKLSKAEYLLVRAERYYNSWIEFPKPQFIRKALQQSEKARKSADSRNFKDVSNFAKEQIEIFKKFDDSKQEQ
jgi:hypothetical protein